MANQPLDPGSVPVSHPTLQGSDRPTTQWGTSASPGFTSIFATDGADASVGSGSGGVGYSDGSGTR